MNIGGGVHASFQIGVFSGYICPGVGLLNHVVTLFLVFWETFILFPIVASPIDISTNSVAGFVFLHTLPSIYYL